MKVVILAGGKGSRLSELTKEVPKPMVKIGPKPILIHIMTQYLKYGYKDFYILTGYKKKIIFNYFKNFKKVNKKFRYRIKKIDCYVTLIDSGKNTMTGGRLKKINPFLKKGEEFLFTYGDGVGNINIKKLVNFHKKNNKLITVTSVRPPARFGEIIIKNDLAVSFKEKPQTDEGWINGGFFVARKEFLNLIKSDKTILEKNPLEIATKKKQLSVYKHYGFWKCMDTIRDKVILTNIYKKNNFYHNF
jgi:glucose-1-phosphate cytidylyltransferase